MGPILLVAAGGALGAVSRYLISTAMLKRFGQDFPFGTLLVNVLGCLLLGALMAWALERPDLAQRTRLFVGMGFLGSLTTFSTFGYETVYLFEHGDPLAAFGNAALNLGVGFAAVVAGQLAVRGLAS
ncbi:MAG: fluoride efflux transporter CrcB [Planctomycetes bacterium]|nr:fluoride efflux transporter CrcB [Planctomycetota bacterium]